MQYEEISYHSISRARRFLGFVVWPLSYGDIRVSQSHIVMNSVKIIRYFSRWSYLIDYQGIILV